MSQTFSKLVGNRNVQIAGVVSAAMAAWALRSALRHNSTSIKRRKPPQLKPEEQIQYMIVEKGSKGPKPHVNAKFFAQLKFLLKIMIPGVWSKETGFLVLIAASLVARTLCDLWMIQNGTLIESAIIEMNRKLFLQRLLKFFYAMPVVSVVNNLMKWSIGELKLRLRTNMTYHMYDQYLKGFTYYKMGNLDNRICNADQLLTTDIDKFCETVTDLYSNVSKPILDIGIYVYRLTVNLGGQTPGVMLGYLLLSGLFLTNLRKPTGRMTVTEQKLEGEFRYINSRLLTNSEEIAFYQGNNREKLTLLASFNKLTNHLRKFLEFRVLMGVIDNVVAKYIATVVGFYSVSIPFFVQDHKLLTNKDESRFQNYYTYGRMLVKLAEAIGRLVLSGRELTRLAGLTSRVTELLLVLQDLNQGHYVRTMVDGSSTLSSPESIVQGDAVMPLVPNSGKIVFQDYVIRFDKVPLVTPNGDVLVSDLTFEVKSGMNVLVCGPNGCGKSSLFRILGELWPMFGGTLTKPPRGKLFYIPQRPYMTLGTLRDQVIYPHTAEEMRRRGRSDLELMQYMELVQLSYLVGREGGWDAIADWLDVLSGGEKQRIGMARLFYHTPQFAILDECTSAVSVDVEGSMYQYCRKVGISLFTVSHRKSLWCHHDYYLKMDGRGDFKFGKISGDTEEFGS